MTHPIGTCLWFNNQAAEAAGFYETVFDDFRLISKTPMVVVFEMGGRRFMNLNGGPEFEINPSISFFVNARTTDEATRLWESLSEGGNVLMPMGKYPWSEFYGWCSDRYGVNWQIMLGHDSETGIVPSMLFTQGNSGKAKEAIGFYTSAFPGSSIVTMSEYEPGEGDIPGHLKYARFVLDGLPFVAMDSSGPHPFVFNEGVSFVVTLDTQEEIDYYWNLLTEGGKPGKCGWLYDRFGVSWQIVPSILGKLMSNPETAPKAFYAFMQMSKFIIADLGKAVG